MTDPNAFLMGSGVRSAKFANIDDSITGFVVYPPEVRDQTDIQTGAPLYWPGSDRKKQQLYVVLRTDEQEDEEDDGLRALYIKSNMHTAVAQAVRKAGAAGLEVGGKLRVVYVGDGQIKQRGFNAPKLYEALYRAPERNGAVDESQQDPADLVPAPAPARKPDPIPF